MSLAASFSGLPGETSHQISSSPAPRSAARLIRRCPRCAGLNEPPRRPMRAMPAQLAWRTRPPNVAPGVAMVGLRSGRRCGDRRRTWPCGRAQAGEAARWTHAREPLPELRRHSSAALIAHECGQHSPRPPDTWRLLPRFRSWSAPFRRQDLADPALARVAASALTRRYVDGDARASCRRSRCFCFRCS